MVGEHLRAVLIFAGVVALSPPAVAQTPANATELAEQVKGHFPPVWKRATENPYIADCSFEQFQLEGGERRSFALTLRFRRGSEGRFAEVMELTAFDNPKGKPFPSYVRGINPRYEFHLKKSFGGTGWLLSGWRLVGEEKPDYRTPVTYAPAILSPFQHLAFGGHPLDEVVVAPGWKVTSIQPSPADAAQTRVAFTYSFIEPTASRAAHRYTGWFDLDPAAGWCIRRSDYQFHLEVNKSQLDKHFACDNHYRLSNDRVPVLTSVRCEDNDVKPDGGFHNPQRRVFQFDTRYQDEVPDIEFTLTAFGLPEPVGVEPPSKAPPRYVWWLVGAGACAALALAFRLVGHRAKRPDVPTAR
jgi:hypothetical protein